MNKGLLQMHSTSRVLLDIYGDVWEKAVSKLLAEDIDESPISVKTFEEVLKPLYWVDWRDSDLIRYIMAVVKCQELLSEFG